MKVEYVRVCKFRAGLSVGQLNGGPRPSEGHGLHWAYAGSAPAHARSGFMQKQDGTSVRERERGKEGRLLLSYPLLTAGRRTAA